MHIMSCGLEAVCIFYLSAHLLSCSCFKLGLVFVFQHFPENILPWNTKAEAVLNSSTKSTKAVVLPPLHLNRPKTLHWYVWSLSFRWGVPFFEGLLSGVVWVTMPEYPWDAWFQFCACKLQGWKDWLYGSKFGCTDSPAVSGHRHTHTQKRLRSEHLQTISIRWLALQWQSCTLGSKWILRCTFCLQTQQ